MQCDKCFLYKAVFETNSRRAGVEIKADVKKDQFGLEDINDFFDEQNESTGNQKENEIGREPEAVNLVADTTSDRSALIANIRRLSSRRKSSNSTENGAKQQSLEEEYDAPRTPPRVIQNSAEEGSVEDPSPAESDSEDVELVTKKGQKPKSKTKSQIPNLLGKSQSTAAALAKKSIFSLNMDSTRPSSQVVGTATPDNGGLFGKSSKILGSSLDKTDSTNSSGKSMFGDSLSVPENSPPKFKRTRSPRKAKPIIIPAEEADRSAAMVIKTREFGNSVSPDSSMQGTRKGYPMMVAKDSSNENNEKATYKKGGENLNFRSLQKENQPDSQIIEPNLGFDHPINDLSQSTPVSSKKHLIDFSDEIDAEITDFKKSKLFENHNSDELKAKQTKDGGSNRSTDLRLNNGTNFRPPEEFTYNTFGTDGNVTRSRLSVQSGGFLVGNSKTRNYSSNEHSGHKPRVFEFPNNTKNRRNRFQLSSASRQNFSNRVSAGQSVTSAGSLKQAKENEEAVNRAYPGSHGRFDSDDFDYNTNTKLHRADNETVPDSGHFKDYDPYTEYGLKDQKYSAGRSSQGFHDRGGGFLNRNGKNSRYYRDTETAEYDDSIVSGLGSNVSIDYKASVLDYLSGYHVIRRLAWAKGAPVFRPSGNNEYSVATLFDEDSHFIASGMISIYPNGFKPSRAAKQNTYMFYVISGIIEAAVSGHIFVLDEGSSFQVPRGNSYSIRNRSGNRSATLFFTHGRDCSVETQSRAYDI